MDVQHEHDKFRADWNIDFRKKLIYRKNPSVLRWIKELILRPKYPVWSLYRFARYHEATAQGISHPEIVDRDMLHKIEELPTRFVLNEPWKIPEQDLKTLYLGPLTQGNKILVPVYPKNGFFFILDEIVLFLGAIGGTIAFIQWLIINVF